MLHSTTFRMSCALLATLAGFPATAHAQEASGDSVKIAHAALGSLAWVVILPVGAILMRFVKGPKAWMVHAAVQGLGLAVITAGAGNGIYLALVTGQLNAYHAIIGLVLFSLAWIQAAGGLLGHILWKKHQRKTLIAHIHVWSGRMLITLGMINGGLGLLLSSDASRGAYIAYGVIAGVIWLLFVSNAALYETRRNRHHLVAEKQ